MAAMVVAPMGLRLVNRVVGTAGLTESYIPAVEAPRQRDPFYAEAVSAIRDANPDYVVIGDSMAGSRIEHRRLSQLVGGRGVVPIFEAGSASAYWYLAFKNWVIASNIHPKAVIFFFRDENLTDPMFRLTPQLLDRVARSREPELNGILAARAQGPWFRMHAFLRDLYEFDRTRAWLEPVITRAPVPLAARLEAREKLVARVNTEVFALEALRPMAAADMATADREKLDFRRNLPASVLPAIIRRAKQAQIKVAFIRVQRRPVDSKPPVASPALQQYVRDLKSYLLANGAYFHDDWGDPEQPLSIYLDGDHIAPEFRIHCTELCFRRNPDLFR